VGLIGEVGGKVLYLSRKARKRLIVGPNAFGILGEKQRGGPGG